MKVRVLECSREEYKGKIVEVYAKVANGILFASKYGIIHLEPYEYEVL